MKLLYSRTSYQSTQTLKLYTIRHSLASSHLTEGSTWQGHTVDPPCDRGAKAIRLSDPQFLPMEFPQFGHCRGVTPGRVFQPATELPGIWRSTCSWRGVVDLPEATQLLKYLPEAVPTLNPCANTCKHDAQEYYFLLRTIIKNKDDL